MKKQLEVNEGVLRGLPNFIRRAFFAMCICMVALSCSKDPTTTDSLRPHEEMVGFQLHIPSSTDVVTRSGQKTVEVKAEADELAIKRGYIFVFESNGSQLSGAENITYEKIFIDSITGNKTVTPKIYSNLLADNRILKGKRVVFVLNYTAMTSEMTDIDLKAVTYETIDTKFPINGVITTATGIPMYGEIDLWDVTNPAAVTIERSVARLVMEFVSSSDEVGSGTVYGIFNVATSGKIKQGEGDNLNYAGANKKPIEASAISDTHLTKIFREEGVYNENNVSYIYEYPHATKIIGLNAASDAAASTRIDKDRLAVILKIKSNSTTNFSYYRLDLVTKSADGSTTYLDVKRNHQYRIVVNYLDDDGYATAEQAYLSGPSNIEYTIIDDTGVVSVSNGNYAISVGKARGGETMEVSTIATEDTVIAGFATDVRCILTPGLIRKSIKPNKISVIVRENGTLIEHTGATVSPGILTVASKDLKVTIPKSVTQIAGEYKISLKYEFGNLDYESHAAFTLKSTAPPAPPAPHGIDMSITPTTGAAYWITIADRNVGVDQPSTANPTSAEAAGVEWYGTYFSYVQKGAACTGWKDINGVGDWRLPTIEEWFTINNNVNDGYTLPFVEYFHTADRTGVIGLISSASSGVLRVNSSNVTDIYLPLAGAKDASGGDVNIMTKFYSYCFANSTACIVTLMPYSTDSSMEVLVEDDVTMSLPVRCVRDVEQ